MSNKHQQVFEDLINKMFEIAGYPDKNFQTTLDEEGFYSKYTMTIKQEQEFMAWGLAHIRKKLRYSKPIAAREMNWFNMAYGLAVPERHALAKEMNEKGESAAIDDDHSTS